MVDRESRKLLELAGVDTDLPSYGREHLESIQKVLDESSMRIVYFNRVSHLHSFSLYYSVYV